ncbi:haloacid dehalogenase [Modestobacter versicolor]|uniref:2-haloalkanoic acid dehalogenase type II n=1 Tax=Modestobacter versicolor TaxID=429133 RepID=A0A323V4S7_9ACTN|nr:haloacid dehalogenase [Modestobacter versicolor]MBB3677143.1 2-haloalkanoic acid dehalogenase type II [Modestobacter versicolor]PZA19825.1 haloacid dehalogenase [Modestobacter versicolor]
MPLVTFDLFSALIDSRTGGSAAFAGLATTHGWDVAGTELYDDWDARNKASQQDVPHDDDAPWVPFAEHCRRALAATYAARGLVADPAADVEVLLGSLPRWPLWPDVEAALPEVARTHRVGVLSNVDDELFRRTRAAALVDEDAVLTSERLRAYKPHPELYLRARGAGVDVHVPASARDTRGALEAGLAVVRVRRPGHRVDPDGPQPEREVADLGQLPAVLLSAGG